MSLVLLDNSMPATTPEILEKIALAEARMKTHEHTFRVEMQHDLHAGMYARTCRVAANQAFSSVLIKIPTLIIVNGDCIVLFGEGWHELIGYNVLQASAGRKQIYVTRGQTEITMIFPTAAKTVEEAEDEFSDESANLLSRRAACQESQQAQPYLSAADSRRLAVSRAE
jgi:hypothetical protein